MTLPALRLASTNPRVSFGQSAPELAGLNQRMNATYKLPGIGDSFQLEKKFTRENLESFCEAVGDLNIKHLQGLDGTIQQGGGGITIPGSFVTAQITRAFIAMFKQFAQGPIFPVYAGQQLKYLAPVRVGDTVETNLSVKSIDYKPSSQSGTANVIYKIGSDIYKKDPVSQRLGQQVVAGEGTIIIRTADHPALAKTVADIRAAQEQGAV